MSPRKSSAEFKEAVRLALNVEIVETTIQGSAIIGSLVAGNSRGIVVSGLATEEEIDILEGHREVLLLKDSMNAAGNVIMANDTFAAVHQDMPTDMAHEIGEFLGVVVIHLTLGGIKTVGMAGAASNKGVIVHPLATAQQIARLEEVAKVPWGPVPSTWAARSSGPGCSSMTAGISRAMRRAGLNWAGLRTYLDFWSD